MKKILAILTIVTLFISCSSDGGDSPATGGGTTTLNYDRSALLKNLADNIIVPSYTDFKSKVGTLKTAINTFTTTPNQANLDALRTDWLTAYKAWQKVEAFNIGKAEEILYLYFMNIYPADINEINTAITSGVYDLTKINFQNSQGFPAMDYLINGLGTDAEIIAKYTSDSESAKRKTYLNAIGERMQTITNTVVNDWSNGYRDTFVNNTESSASGSVNKIINDYIYYYEKGFRSNKLGIPAGVFSGGTTFPDKVEAYYKGDVSKDLAKEAFSMIKTIYKGGSGYGLEDALLALDKTELNSKIKTKFDEAETALNSLGANFSTEIASDQTKVLGVYDKIQAVVRLLKVDMASALSVNIDYVDADGD